MSHAQMLDRLAVEAEARRALRKSPKVWAWEFARLALYVLGRVIFTPWCLVWPALTVWLIWWAEGISAREAIELFAAGPDRAFAWIFVIGATVHSLAIVGSDPYEWEIDRRVRARLLTLATRARRAGREVALGQPIQPSRTDDRFDAKGWERIAASSKAS
jgi:hypothetical protein